MTTHMEQKVLKVGTSAAVTLSKNVMKELGLKTGDMVQVDIDKKTKTVMISPTISVDQELFEWTKEFVERYRPALEELSKK